MAVIVYHIHFARPSAFAAKPPNNHVIRLMLMPETKTSPYGVWIFRRGEWGPPRYGNVPPGT